MKRKNTAENAKTPENGWREEIIGELRGYEECRTAVDNLQRRWRLLEEEYRALCDGEIPGSKDDLMANVDERERIGRRCQLSRQRVLLTERGLASLDGKQRRILELFYIRRPDDYIERLSEELFVERSRLYELKDDALRSLAAVLYGSPEGGTQAAPRG